MGLSLIEPLTGPADFFSLFSLFMSTRSGATYKPMDESRDGRHAHAKGSHAASQGTTGGALPELTSLTKMFQAMLEDRQCREEQITEECRRYTEESERHMDDMRKQMECLQKIVTEHSTGSASSRERSGKETVKLTRLGNNDDIEAYLTTFERVMLVHEVRKDRWPYQLAPQLRGKAQQAYATLPPDEAKTYEAVKEAILRRYNITAETYRQRFRNLRPKEAETPQELVTCLKDLGSRWMRDSKTREELLDLMVKEQFLEILPEDARIAVIDRQPKDSDEAARIAGNYFQARSMTMT